MVTESRNEIICGLTYTFITTRSSDGYKLVVMHGARVAVSMCPVPGRELAGVKALARRLAVCHAGDVAAGCF